MRARRQRTVGVENRAVPVDFPRRSIWQDALFPAPVLSAEPAYLHYPGRKCFNRIIETGVLHGVGLRNTLEPDPDNTGVGSFLGLTAFFLET